MRRSIWTWLQSFTQRVQTVRRWLWKWERFWWNGYCKSQRNLMQISKQCISVFKSSITFWYFRTRRSPRQTFNCWVSRRCSWHPNTTKYTPLKPGNMCTCVTACTHYKTFFRCRATSWHSQTSICSSRHWAVSSAPWPTKPMCHKNSEGPRTRSPKWVCWTSIYSTGLRNSM
jgi:hypothetical protein